MLIEIEKEFIGIGEVSGFKFTRIGRTDAAYCYEVAQEGVNTHYEVFRRKNTPVCIDFEKRIYSETEFKETYPKSNAFGVWAWTCSDVNKALNFMSSIEVKKTV
jgi:hypothetical protein